MGSIGEQLSFNENAHLTEVTRLCKTALTIIRSREHWLALSQSRRLSGFGRRAATLRTISAKLLWSSYFQRKGG